MAPPQRPGGFVWHIASLATEQIGSGVSNHGDPARHLWPGAGNDISLMIALRQNQVQRRAGGGIILTTNFPVIGQREKLFLYRAHEMADLFRFGHMACLRGIAALEKNDGRRQFRQAGEKFPLLANDNLVTSLDRV